MRIADGEPGAFIIEEPGIIRDIDSTIAVANTPLGSIRGSPV
jgi:hypothetical protein